MYKEIIDNNTLIFDFMGCEHSKDETIDLWEMSGLKYHHDWSHLMPVVEKIESLEYNFGYGTVKPDVIISRNTSYISIGDNDIFINGKGVVGISKSEPIYYSQPTKIGAVYNTIIQFIKWYNSKTQTNG